MILLYLCNSQMNMHRFQLLWKNIQYSYRNHSRKKKGIENELCSFENYLGGIGKQLCGFEMTCWALCGVETTQVKLKLL